MDFRTVEAFHLIARCALFPKPYPQPLLPQISLPNKGQTTFSKISSHFPKVKALGRIIV